MATRVRTATQLATVIPTVFPTTKPRITPRVMRDDAAALTALELMEMPALAKANMGTMA